MSQLNFIVLNAKKFSHLSEKSNTKLCDALHQASNPKSRNKRNKSQ